MPDSDYVTDFFVSHADADLEWAEWIAAELESAGYGVIVKAWDFRPGENTLSRHDEALATCRHTICVLSENYVASEVATRTAAQYQALTGKERALIPVRVAACDPPPLIGPTIAIELSGVEDADEARRRLLSGVAGCANRVARGGFPGARASKVRFPGVPAEIWEVRGRRADPYFTGRDDILAELHRALRAGHPASAVQVITGLGGQGKTALVVEYAFRHAAAYDLIWWIRAEDPATMRGDYAELARELGLPAEKDDQAIAALRRELRRRRNWLLIFDNAEDPDELFPLMPERHPGHVLITSRLREWPYAETRQLDVLPASAAAGYLQRRGRVSDVSTAANIADALGCLPLALLQAASAIAEGMSADEYLDLLLQQSSKVLAEGRTSDRDITIATTWRMSTDRLALRSTAAVALFRLAAFLAADAIPLSRLTATDTMPAELARVLTDPFERRQATAALGEYSLAQTADGLLSIHRLVQAVTRSELGRDESHWASIALAAIAAAFPGDEQDPKTWPTCEEILAHALACTAHSVRLQVDATSTVQLLDRVARYLLARGRHDSADAAVAQAVAAAKSLDHRSPIYLSCRNTYGQLLLAQGDHAAARAIHEETYQARKQILGPEDPDTLRSGRDLVEALHYQGQSVEAAQLLDHLVASFTAVLGPDDLETIKALAYLATILYSAGQYTRARELEEQVVEARTGVLGEDHPDTLLAQANLAISLGSLGELKRARAIQEKVLAAQTRVLGEDHPVTLGTRGNLARTLYGLGDLRRARTIEEEVLEALTRVLGEDHPNTIDARASLAGTLRGLGELDQARAIEEEVLETRTRVQGRDHPATIGARASLAGTVRDLGELDQARAIQEQVLETLTRVLGEEHPGTLTAMAELALTRLMQGNEDEKAALSLLAEILEIALRVFGKKHTVTTEAAWRLVENCGVHEAARRRALVVRYLSWLGHEPPGNLTASQKEIKEGIKGKKQGTRGKKRSAPGKKKRR